MFLTLLHSLWRLLMYSFFTAEEVAPNTGSRGKTPVPAIVVGLIIAVIVVVAVIVL